MADKRTLLSLCSEEEFLEHVIGYAQLQHWKVAHFRPARTGKGWRTAMSGDPGFPDLVLVRKIDYLRSELLFLELKSTKGKLTEEQDEWLTLLGNAQGIHAYCLRPEDWPDIMKLLE